MKNEQLYQEARIKASSVVPDEARQSLPIPVMRNSRLQVDYLFAPNQLSAVTGEMLFTPTWQISFDWKNGDLLELQKVSPAYYGIHQEAGQEIGRMSLPEGMDAMEFLARRKRLLELCDHLFDAFASGDTAPTNKEQAREYRSLFNDVSEPPLLPYYESRGREFFQWIDKLVRSP